MPFKVNRKQTNCLYKKKKSFYSL